MKGDRPVGDASHDGFHGDSPSSVVAGDSDPYGDGASPGGPCADDPCDGAHGDRSPRSAGRRRGSGPRRSRRPTPWRAAFFALATFGIIAAVTWALLGDRLLVVRSITVTGTHLVTPGQVVAAAGVPLGTPLVRVDSGTVARRVETIRQVATARVTRHWPDHLVIEVTERVPVLAVRMAGGGYDLVDHDGVIVRWARIRPPGMPLLNTTVAGRALRGDPGVLAAAEVIRELKPWLARQVVAANAARVLTGAGASSVAAERVTLDLRDGKTVLWGAPGNAAHKNRELAILLGKTAHSINVSAPGVVAVR